MFSLVYVSSAVTPFTEQELVELLKEARNSNARAQVTGMLLYKDGNFMQALEGDERTVRELYAKICLDSRHKGAMIVVQGEQAAREFPDWSMGFRNLHASDIHNIAGYNEFLNTPLGADAFSQSPHRARKLLATFKKNMK